MISLTRVGSDSGSEGPRHDPYGYDEVWIERNGVRVTSHQGLGSHIAVQEVSDIEARSGTRNRLAGRKIVIDTSDSDHDQLFLALTGFSVRDIMRAQLRKDRARYRQHRGHGGIRDVDGFPGETFTVCKCGAHLYYHFDRRAIE